MALVLPLVACCFVVVAAAAPSCCNQGHTLALVPADGSFRPLCANMTAEDYDYYTYYEDSLANVSCPAEYLRSVALHSGGEDPVPRRRVECADLVDGRLVGLFCDVVYSRCCREGARYNPDGRVCVDVRDYIPDDVLDEVAGGNASRAHLPVDCAGADAVVDDFAPAGDVEILPDGRLRVAGGPELEPGTFCVEGTTLGADRVVVRRCDDVRRACAERPCFRKCCVDGEVLEDTGECAPSDVFAVSRLPTTYDVVGTLEILNHSVAKGFAVAFGKECPNGKFPIDPYGADHAELAANGDLLYDGSALDVDSYCVDSYAEGSIVVALCFPEEGEVDGTTIPLYITVGMIASSVFLLATLATYALLPALLNLHGKTLMCHVVSLLTAYVCLSCTHLSAKAMYETGWCTAIAYIMIFTFISAFSWLNVMCFDIWWTFSTVRYVTQCSRQQREKRRFLWYNLYSWSLAALVVVVTCIVDNAGDAIPLQIRPLIGNDTCFYSNRTDGQKVFFELPVMVLTIVNIVFFVLTARNCYKVKAELQRLQSKEGERGKRRFEANKNRLITTAKLFVVMGVTWVMEFIGSVCSPENALWIPADIANSLQGVLIFCIFVLKRKVLKKLGQRLSVKSCLQRGRAVDRHTAAGSQGYDLWRMRKISSNSTLYTNSTMLLPSGIASGRNK